MRKRLSILNTVIREGFTEKVSFEPNLERGEGEVPACRGGRVIPGETPTDAKCLRQQVARTLLSTDHVRNLEFPWDTETGLSAPQPQ